MRGNQRTTGSYYLQTQTRNRHHTYSVNRPPGSEASAAALSMTTGKRSGFLHQAQQNQTCYCTQLIGLWFHLMLFLLHSKRHQWFLGSDEIQSRCLR